MSENRVQLVIEGEAKSAQVAIEGTGKQLVDLSTQGDKASKSLKDADASTSTLGKSAQAASQSIKSADEATSNFSKSTQANGQAANEASSSLMGYVSNLKALAAAYGLFKAAEAGKDTVLDAARYETMTVVMHTMGNAAGYTTEQMDAYSESLQRQGISMEGAQESLARMIQGNIDLEKGVRLATAAQGAAIVMGRSSTEAFETMTTAIATGLVINLHRMGIMADFEGAYAREAAALGKSKDALTDRERVQARTNEALSKSKMLEDVYAAAMGTAGKQMWSMVRYLSDFSTMVGSIGLETFTRGVFGSADALKEMNAELRKMMADGTIASWSANIANAFSEAWKVIKLTTEVLGLFWLAWRGSVAIETALLTLGLLKLELRTLAADITAAGGAWNYLNAQMTASVALFTTVSGILVSIASAMAGILIGKYLVDNFKWAAEACLSMGETILTALAKIKGEYLIGVASLSGQQEEAEQKLAARLLTIRMTYLHERLDLDKKFAPTEQKAKAPEVLGSPVDQKGTQSLEKMNAMARKVQDAYKTLKTVQDETAQFQAETGGDAATIALAKLQSELDKFEEQAKEKKIGAPAEAQSLIDAAIAAKRREIDMKRAITLESLDLDKQKTDSERSVQLTSLENTDTYYADLEAIRAKYAAARLKPRSDDAQWAGVMESAEMAKRTRDQRKANSDRNLGYESELNKGMSDLYATQSGHSVAGALDEQSQAVEIERQQRVLALSEKQPQAEDAIYEVRRRTGDDLGPKDQEELDARQKELDLVNVLLDVTNTLAGVKQQEIATSRTWQTGMRKGFQDYADAASDYASQAKNAVTNAFSSMEDAFANMVVKGKGDWSSLVDTILMDLVKIQLRTSITGPISSWLGGLNILGSAHGNVLGGDGISALSNGIYSQPTFFGYDNHITAYAKGGVLGEAGPEAVMPLTRDSSGNLGVRAQGGGMSLSATINVNVPASSGNARQDQTYADNIGDAVTGGLDAWWTEKYRQAHRPGAVANGGVNL